MKYKLSVILVETENDPLNLFPFMTKTLDFNFQFNILFSHFNVASIFLINFYRVSQSVRYVEGFLNT